MPAPWSHLAKGSGLVGYNVQTAVDVKHRLIVAHEVTDVGNDRAQLSKMAKAARQAMDTRGLQACEDVGITAFVPKPMTSGAKAAGRFDKSDFIYIAKDDQYQCPAGERAIYRFSTLEKNGLNAHVYWTSACPTCAIKDQCTTGEYRRIRRWEHEEVLERAQQRLDKKPDAMTLRRRTVEHVFGTLKHWMGSTHLLTKTLAHVGTEMNLHVLAYNLKRVVAILGIAKTMKAMRLVGVWPSSTHQRSRSASNVCETLTRETRPAIACGAVRTLQTRCFGYWMHRRRFHTASASSAR
jgi:hypothetical protein